MVLAHYKFSIIKRLDHLCDWLAAHKARGLAADRAALTANSMATGHKNGVDSIGKADFALVVLANHTLALMNRRQNCAALWWQKLLGWVASHARIVQLVAD